jgi:hypothetical protein
MKLWSDIKARLNKRKAQTSAIEPVVDDNVLTREQSERLLKVIEEHHKVQEDDNRRSLGISTGFFEKLATLDAGSIAVSASIIVAILLKPELRESTRGIVDEIVVVVLLLWTSLFSSIVHNFVAVRVANLGTR